MKEKLEERFSGMICPQCREERTFIKAKTLITDPLPLYECEECKVKVSLHYLKLKTFQEVYRRK